MRSLVVAGVTVSSLSTSAPPASVSEPARAILAIDPDTLRVYAVPAASACVLVHDSARAPSMAASSSASPILLTPEDPATTPVAIHYSPDSLAIVVAFSSGEIALVDPTGVTPHTVVGDIDDGIIAMAWSPDGELGVFVSTTGGVFVMTPQFDIVGEAVVDASSSVNNFVSVGWGKKETQFHGSLGKEAAKQTLGVISDSLVNSDDSATRITWRGDGKYFAVCFIDNTSKRRAVSVFTREGSLTSTTEPVPLLHHVIAWRPQGNLIAAVQTLPSRQLQVVFFETNGLRHGEFSLRLSESEANILELAWNSDSTVLAVFMEKEAKKCIQLWTMGNYHYYLKQELYGYNGDISGFLWDPEEPLRLLVAAKGGSLLQTCSFIPVVQTSSSASSESSQPVIVTDGLYLLVTPFRTSNVPPPMCETKVGPFSSPVASVFVGENEALAVLLADGSINVVYNINDSKAFRIKRVEYTPSENIWIRQIVFSNPSNLLVIASSLDASLPDAVLVLEIKTVSENESVAVTATSRIDEIPGAEAGLMRLTADLRSANVIVESSNGLVSELFVSDDMWLPEIITELPVPCPWISSINVGSDLKTVIVALSTRNRLYINSRLVSSEVTSFFIHDQHIILTTMKHTARFIPLDVAFEEDLDIPEAGASLHDESVRRVERGSRIVAAVPGDMKLVLQMPRGNLETVYPRALVLAIIRSSLEKLDFRNAFLLCRKHRINMNLLVDHSPKQFMENIELFVSQIEDPDFLNLFVSSLGEFDVTKTMYAPVRTGASEKAPYFEFGAKVNKICLAIRSALEPLDKVKYVTTRLTSFAKMVPQDLEGAMRAVKDMKSVSLEETESAMKYIIFLANSNLLYDVALGMYDFQLVVMVAQFSHKDPREYLPFLSALKALPKNRQYFRIDDHLGRHSSALHHLFEVVAESESSAITSGSADAENIFSSEVIPYISKHGLFKLGLEKYEDNRPRLQQVLLAYAEFLFSKANFAEAGLMFYMANDKQRALQSYQSDFRQWKCALSLAQEVKMDNSKVVELAYELAEQLTEKHEHLAAATVLVDYARDVLAGIRALIKGSFWEEAIRIAHANNRDDLVDSEITPGILAEYENMTDDLKEMATTFQKQRSRLDIVRKEFFAHQAKVDAGEYDPLLDSVDMMSDTTSMASSHKTGFSARTGKSTVSTGYTAKSRRRAEKKRAAGREGGFYEEEFLVNNLFKSVEKSNNLRPSVHSLVTALMQRMYLKEARALQRIYSDAIAIMQECCAGVFEPENIANKGSAGKTVEEEKIAYMVKIGSLPPSMLPASMAPDGTLTEAEKKRDPKYPEKPPIDKVDGYPSPLMYVRTAKCASVLLSVRAVVASPPEINCDAEVWRQAKMEHASADAQLHNLDPKLTIPTEPLPPIPRRPRASKSSRLRDADLGSHPDAAFLQTQAQMTIAGMLPFPDQIQSGSPAPSNVVESGITTAPDAARGSSSTRGRSILRTTRRSSRKPRDSATLYSDTVDGVSIKTESNFSLSPDRASTRSNSSFSSGSTSSSRRRRIHVCTVCSKDFTRAEHLARHIKCTHEGIKEFQCPICFKMYGRQDERLRHLRMHAKKGETVRLVDGNSDSNDPSVDTLGLELNDIAIAPGNLKESDSQTFSSKYNILADQSSPSAEPESNNPRSSWSSSLGSSSVVNLSDASHRSSTVTFSNTLVSPSASTESYPNIALKAEDTFSTSSADIGGTSNSFGGAPLKVGVLPSNLAACRWPIASNQRPLNNSKSAQFLEMQYMHNQRNLYLLQQQRRQQFQVYQAMQATQPTPAVGVSDDISMSLWQHQQLQQEQIEILSLQHEQLRQFQQTQLQRDPSSHIPFLHVHQPQDHLSSVPFTAHDQIQQNGGFVKRAKSSSRSPNQANPNQIGFLAKMVGIEAMKNNDNSVSAAAAEAFPFRFED
ncbi:hypothetical protein HDU84_003206 [Entophlyctis sp. JEL0112]|nr:hypothetical protein HDU84_003206 [Entophlyctis sp. JEL0112]